MRFTGSTPPRQDDDDERPDWQAMDRRLTKIEDALITIQTVVNLMLDLLEQAIPIDPDDSSHSSD
jgi:hypothetical protein